MAQLLWADYSCDAATSECTETVKENKENEREKAEDLDLMEIEIQIKQRLEMRGFAEDHPDFPRYMAMAKKLVMDRGSSRM